MDITITNLSDPICNVPNMIWGSQPRDGGHFILTPEEREHLLKKEPKAKKWIREFLGGYELVNNKERYCLWLNDISPNELKELPMVYERVQKVKQFRISSKAPSTQKKSHTPTLFAQIAQPNVDYLALPEVSSERRKYIPMRFLKKNVIASNKIQMIPNANLWHFGILNSVMHMTWMKYTCGRMKSDFSYSNSIVYNNYPWPQKPSDKQRKTVEEKAQHVLAIRELFPESTLADLYDPLTMPPQLLKAHFELDKAVDLCYRSQPFTTDAKRMEFLFELYEKYTAGLFAEEKKSKKK